MPPWPTHTRPARRWSRNSTRRFHPPVWFAAHRGILRSRRIPCVVFSVDERLTGRPQIPNDAVAQFAADNSDIAIAFASADPTRWPEEVRDEVRPLILKENAIKLFSLAKG
jgi:hypothetical protein